MCVGNLTIIAAEAASRAEAPSGGVSDRQEIRSSVQVPPELQDLINDALTPEERARIGRPELVS